MLKPAHDRTPVDGYPFWVCLACGQQAKTTTEIPFSTWHEGTCGVCGQLKAVTEPRDFGYPVFHMKHLEAVRG